MTLRYECLKITGRFRMLAREIDKAFRFTLIVGWLDVVLKRWGK